MRISDWSSDVCSSDLTDPLAHLTTPPDGPSQPYDKNTPMLQPGTYSDMQIKANHTFAPGIYTIDGGSLKVAAQYNLSGSGVIFVLKNGARSEARSVGTECVSTGRSRWWQYP